MTQADTDRSRTALVALEAKILNKIFIQSNPAVFRKGYCVVSPGVYPGHAGLVYQTPLLKIHQEKKKREQVLALVTGVRSLYPCDNTPILSGCIAGALEAVPSSPLPPVPAPSLSPETVGGWRVPEDSQPPPNPAPSSAPVGSLRGVRPGCQGDRAQTLRQAPPRRAPRGHACPHRDHCHPRLTDQDTRAPRGDVTAARKSWHWPEPGSLAPGVTDTPQYVPSRQGFPGCLSS